MQVDPARWGHPPDCEIAAWTDMLTGLRPPEMVLGCSAGRWGSMAGKHKLAQPVHGAPSYRTSHLICVTFGLDDIQDVRRKLPIGLLEPASAGTLHSKQPITACSAKALEGGIMQVICKGSMT